MSCDRLIICFRVIDFLRICKIQTFFNIERKNHESTEDRPTWKDEIINVLIVLIMDKHHVRLKHISDCVYIWTVGTLIIIYLNYII